MNRSFWLSFRSCNLVQCLIANRSPKITVSCIEKLFKRKNKVAGDDTAASGIFLVEQHNWESNFSNFLIRLKSGTVSHLLMTDLAISLHLLVSDLNSVPTDNEHNFSLMNFTNK